MDGTEEVEEATDSVKGMGGLGLPSPSSPPCLRASVVSSLERVDLEPAGFFALLFGAVEPAAALAGVAEGPGRALAGLFPRGAPVYWRTDVV